ncbi:hypothetical protein [Sulfurimonas sp. HSL3-2]|uniref:hypothetical protein n=1 Tax=Hydrocurvibacter mobilis TaxID=3131936 RepID=UPI0031F96D9B
MKKITLAILFITIVIFSGCSGNTKYAVQPTPLKKGSSQYYLKDINVTLHKDGFENQENKTFYNQAKLQAEFKDDLQKDLNTKNMNSSQGFGLVINLDYTRIYLYGGNALAKPKFIYSVDVYTNDGNTLLAHYSIPESTTKYAYLEDVAVNTKVMLFQWNAENEPKDIALISDVLTREISELGD